jgi:hypothetical protein
MFIQPFPQRPQLQQCDATTMEVIPGSDDPVFRHAEAGNGRGRDVWIM